MKSSSTTSATYFAVTFSSTLSMGWKSKPTHEDVARDAHQALPVGLLGIDVGVAGRDGETVRHECGRREFDTLARRHARDVDEAQGAGDDTAGEIVGDEVVGIEREVGRADFVAAVYEALLDSASQLSLSSGARFGLP